jgi:hypothetical protein
MRELGAERIVGLAGLGRGESRERKIAESATGRAEEIAAGGIPWISLRVHFQFLFTCI